MGKPATKSDFKCGCEDPDCKLEEQVRKRADILGVSLQMVAFSLNLLKNTAGATPITGLKELSGGLLAVVSALQDKREVKGGLKHIIVDCLKVTCIVCQHAKRRKNHISPVIETAISELNLELSKIREQADKMNKRGWFMRFIMGAADKAAVGALRQQLTTSWGLFSTELQMDTNYKVTKADKLEPVEVLKRMFDDMAAKHQIRAHHSPAPPCNTSPQKPDGYGPHDQPQWNERDHTPQSPAQGGSQNPNGNSDRPHWQPSQASQSNYHGQNMAPQSEIPRHQYDNRHLSQSQTGQSSHPNHQPYPYSEPPPDSRAPNSHDYQSYGHGYSQWSPPAPLPPPSVNNFGSAKNVNFGTNDGRINQVSS